MRIFWLFCALGALLGCRQVSEPSGQAIALFCSTDQGAKTEALTEGEEVAVFACPEGTEDYFLEAAQFIVGSDGRSLTYGSTVYYPDPKQAVRFFAYFPYHTGAFSVPTDQSKPEALKQADLCGAVASTTPVATPVALAFEHLMARLVITTNKPTEKIVFPNAVASGVVHAATAEFVLGTVRKDIWTTGNELIVPVQPLSRLVLTVLGVEYVFDGSVSLEAGKTTTLDLTLHPDTHTATLSGSSIADWVSLPASGDLSHAVSNVLTIHWAPTAHPLSSVVDRIVCTINGADYAVLNGIAYSNDTFTVPFASSALRYPYTITKIAFYRGVTPICPACVDLLGAMIYKSGASTVGIKDQIVSSVLIDGIWWATGNLVASNAAAGEQGLGGCRIGAPADHGLYFQFGSLIGYKGGALANSGTGVGSTANGAFWNGAATFSWANDAMVWPTNLSGNPTSWPQGAITNQWYFGLQAGWSVNGQNIRDFLNFSTGGLANVGVGDPCSYYLGGTWRLPTQAEYTALTNTQGSGWIPWTDNQLSARWVSDSQSFSGVKCTGMWAGPGMHSTATPDLTEHVFIPAAGYRHFLLGVFGNAAVAGTYWTATVASATNAHRLDFANSSPYIGICAGSNNSRSNGYTVRCVSN